MINETANVWGRVFQKEVASVKKKKKNHSHKNLLYSRLMYQKTIIKKNNNTIIKRYNHIPTVQHNRRINQQ